MPPGQSPLRYPGGKQALAGVLSRLMELNGVTDGTYIEPYAGGAGAAISLLFSEHARRIHINDADPCIFAFWSAVLNHTDALIDLIMKVPLNVAEWEKQRSIYVNHVCHTTLEAGFATFFLNRCNRSGIIAGGGVIGGKSQSGIWKIDARFNRMELARRITRIALYGERITLSQVDGIELLSKIAETQPAAEKFFIYLDPPYFVKGRDLYLNYYRHEDHKKLADFLIGHANFPWILSYDDVPEIRNLYAELRQIDLSFNYSAGKRKLGKEIFVVPSELAVPCQWSGGGWQSP